MGPDLEPRRMKLASGSVWWLDDAGRLVRHHIAADKQTIYAIDVLALGF